MAQPLPTVALFIRYPAPGRAKTRLAPALGDKGAARVHRLLVERTLATLRDSGLPFELRVTGAPLESFVEWLGADMQLVDQGDGDLGERLARVQAPAILLGADIPGLAACHLREAANAMTSHDVVIGPAQDGGYYLIGFREPVPFLWPAMPWGTSIVRAETVGRLQARGLGFAILEELADCDRPEDLAAWPELLP